MNFHTRPEWQNIEVQSINRLPAHSPWENTHSLSLDGTWKFLLCEHPSLLPAGFYLPDLNDARWREITVPGNWELQGESEPIYTNYAYPFTDEPGAHLIMPSFTEENSYASTLNPPHLPDKIPTGLYRRSFELPEHFVGKKLILRFDGVESGFYVWVNGNPVGYSQDSKLPAEFDVTRYVYAGENNITAQVMRFTDATWMEDQDYWHLSGIFRSVTLFAKPRLHIEDARVTASADGTLSVDVAVTRASGFADTLVRLHIYDPDGKIIYKEKRAPAANAIMGGKNQCMPGHARFHVKIDHPQLWTPETPTLYRVHLALLDPMSGDAADRERVRFGFRTVAIENGILTLNGTRLIVRGVNRHEHSVDHGRAVPREQMKKEILLMKSLGVNAVRTCHYPDSPVWYDLCDEYGLAVVCETNLETHGVGAMLSNDPEWAEAYLQRARRMAQTHKNHPSILIWSLGNESGAGPHHAAMAAWLRAYDPSRPVQYESGDPGREISDILCPMYPTQQRIIDLLMRPDDNRPMILCEYSYQILNSGGGLKHFRELTERFPRFQGGFIWDFQDKALWQTDADGHRYAGYGGDFFEAVTEPFEPKFMCMNGIVTHDLTVKPAGLEAAAVYAPVFLTKIAGNRYVLKNRHHALSTAGYTLTWTSYAMGGEPTGSGEMALPEIAPMTEAEIAFGPGDEIKPNGYLDADIASPGGKTYSQQFLLPGTVTLPRRARFVPAAFEDAHGMIAVTGPAFRMEISKSTGFVVSMQKCGREYVLNALRECAVRGFSGLSAQPGWGKYDEWTAFAQDNVSRRLISLNVSALADGRVQVERLARMSSRTFPGASVDTRLTLLVSGDGQISLKARFLLAGVPSVERLGYTWTLPEGFENVEWFGQGPGESYPDRKEATRLGLYSTTVSEMHFPFTPPSENGGREDVRYVSFSARDGAKLSVRAANPFHFDARHYTVSDLRDAMHDHELPLRAETVFHIDAVHAGIGGDMGWSTALDPQYEITPGEYSLALEIELG